MRKIWIEAFTPPVFDLDARGEVTPAALCRYFGVAAGHHASELGLGDETLRPQGIAWMLNRLEIRFREPAAGMDEVVVETWPSDRSGRIRAERDFRILRGETVLAEGLSTWLLIQLASRRPVRMPAKVLSIAVQGKAAPFEASREPAEDATRDDLYWSQPAGWLDLDINGHVSFPRLVEWTLNAAPPEHWAQHRLDSMILKFEQEVLPGEEVSARFAASASHFKHALTKDTGWVAVRGWSTWRAL